MLGRFVVGGCLLVGSVAGFAQDAAPTPTPTSPPAPVRLAAGVVAGNLISATPPVYPPVAKAAGVQGPVVMHAVINKEGHIANLTVLSGPDLLRDAAVDAVKSWQYHPYLLNGEPTEVDTTITVNFNLNKGPIRISTAVMEHQKISGDKPHGYHGATGAVVLMVQIDAEGNVSVVTPVSGPAALLQPASDAVKTWKYKPFLLNGAPVPVQTTVVVNF